MPDSWKWEIESASMSVGDRLMMMLEHWCTTRDTFWTFEPKKGKHSEAARSLAEGMERIARNTCMFTSTDSGSG
jgi:hypothetical protein